MPIGTLKRPDARAVLLGACLGALAGLLWATLGGLEITGLSDRDPGAALVGLLAGVGIVAIGWLVPLLALNIALLTVYLVVAFTPLVGGAVGALVRDDGPPSAPVDAVIVLSGSVESNGALGESAFERLIAGLEIVKRVRAPQLVLTHVSVKYRDGDLPSDREQLRLARFAGVDSVSIVRPVANTHDEALRSAALLLPARKSVIVVTSPLHTRRACATFEKAGFTVHCAPALEHEAVTRRPETARDRLFAFRAWIYERLGILEYRWRGWIA